MLDPFAPVVAALARPGRPSSDHGMEPDHAARQAAVLIAFQETPAGLQLYLTRRSAHLRHHPGQIALPGGKVEHADPSPVVTALREAHEEIGLAPENVQILGQMSPHQTVTGFVMTPVVARICAPFTPVRQPDEVEEIFTVPFSHIGNPALYRIERRFWRGTLREYYVAPWGPYYIWGATARILHRLATEMTA